MNLKEILVWKELFSYRQKVGLLVFGGVIVGLGGLFMYLLRAHTYFVGDDPAACVNCHMPYMQEGGVKFSDHHLLHEALLLLVQLLHTANS